jgi:hypothetical protein
VIQPRLHRLYIAASGQGFTAAMINWGTRLDDGPSRVQATMYIAGILPSAPTIIRLVGAILLTSGPWCKDGTTHQASSAYIVVCCLLGLAAVGP